MKNRIYGEHADIDFDNTKTFWQSRTNEDFSMRTVLLGSDKSNTAQTLRNMNELELFNSVIPIKEPLKILDIGSGIGRWPDNLHDRIEKYDGIDYTEAFVEYANQKYKDNPNINFYKMSATDIDLSKLTGDYNLIITTGVLMYINDSELGKIFEMYRKLSPEYIYLQESVSIMETRLTLKDFESKEMNVNYSAIYRTSEEYEKYFNGFDIIDTGLLLNEKNGSREETNARWWVLKRGK